MKIKHITKKLGNIFCSGHGRRQRSKNETGQQPDRCFRYGRENTKSQLPSLHILLPEQFAGSKPEDGGG